ncbi:MAG TPA: thioredoxin family protein, partial [Gemmatimonadaceae bacterium]|nr:thioredoxin family protein [Gemmatimonadaceae bacterium]
STLITRETTLIAWMVIALAAVVYLVRNALIGRRPARWLPAVAAVGVALWLGNGARGVPLGEVEAFLPPSDIDVVPGSGALEVTWIVNDHPKALELAARSGKLVLIDFTGYTCTNCRWMEANMFSRAQIAESMSRYVLSRLYTDGAGDIYERQQKFQEDQFGTIALPLYAIVDAHGRTVRTFSGLTRSPAEFLAFLRDA